LPPTESEREPLFVLRLRQTTLNIRQPRPSLLLVDPRGWGGRTFFILLGAPFVYDCLYFFYLFWSGDESGPLLYLGKMTRIGRLILCSTHSVDVSCTYPLSSRRVFILFRCSIVRRWIIIASCHLVYMLFSCFEWWFDTR